MAGASTSTTTTINSATLLLFSPGLSARDQKRLLVVLVTGVSIASSALTAFGIFTFQARQRKRRRRDLQDNVRRATSLYDDHGDDSPPIEPGQKRSQDPSTDAGDLSSIFSLPRTPHPPASPLIGNTPTRGGGGGGGSSSLHHSFMSIDGGTPRYLSQLQLQAAATAASQNQRHANHSSASNTSSAGHHTPGQGAYIPPPLMPKPHRTSSSSSLRSITTASTLVPSLSASQSGATATASRFAQTYPESLIREQLARHYSFFSPATLQSQRQHLLDSGSQHPELRSILPPHSSTSQNNHAPTSRQSLASIAHPPASLSTTANEELEGMGMPAIRSAFVVIVGVGGVGSHAALALLRSGVSHIRLIDFDQVSLSSLNRHACATLADVGRSKVAVCQEKFAGIAPWALIEPYNELFRAPEGKRLLASPRKPDFIIDAIDNIDTKVDLLAYAYNNNIRIITASGAGAKSDPSRIQIADLSATSEDPLARAVRRRLKLLGIPRIRDKPGEAHGSAPRQRTIKKREHKEAEAAKAAANTDSGSTAGPSTSGASDAAAKDGNESLEAFATPAPSPSASQDLTEAEEAEQKLAPLVTSGLTSPSPARRLAHSRRASSTSSIGNARYHTPLMSPSGLLAREDEGRSPPPPMALEIDQPSVTSAGETGSDSAQNEVDPRSNDEGDEAETTDRKAHQRDRKSHSHALTPSAMMRASLEVDQATGQRLTLPCVFSTEKSDVRLLELPESELGKGQVEELAALEDFRVRVLPVLGPIPAMFGLAAATYVLCEIAGWPMEPLPFLNRRKMYDKMLSDLEVCERKFPYQHASTTSKFPFSLTDIAYLTEEVFHSRSCVPPFTTLTTSGTLMRWDSTLPLGFNNVVLLSKEEGKIHAQQVLKAGRSPWEVWGRAAAEEVKRRMVAERRMQVFR